MRFSYHAAAILITSVFRFFFGAKARYKQNVPPGGPFILASNHISYYDPPLIGSFAGREMHFMAKRELFRNPFLGKLISHFNAHPINRTGFDKTAIDTAIAILKSGEGILIFPEGTRAKNGDFLPPRPGIGLIGISSLVPIIPTYIVGSNRLWRCFLRREKLEIIFGRPLTVEELSRYSKDKEGYQRLAGEIMERIKGLKDEFIKDDIRG
jgi:1-acyl-sn-glycerol-3-phosphate acyltransferase